MKKIFFPFLLVFLSFSAFSQRNVVKFNAGALIEKTFSLGFERTLNDKNSLQLTLDYHTEKDPDPIWGDKYTGVGVTGEYRIYGLIPAISNADDVVLNGFFVAPAASLRFISYKSLDRRDPFDEHNTVIQLGGVVGYQWIPTPIPQLSLEASLGLFAGFASGEDSGFGDEFGIGQRFNSGFAPAISISIGYVFPK